MSDCDNSWPGTPPNSMVLEYTQTPYDNEPSRDAGLTPEQLQCVEEYFDGMLSSSSEDSVQAWKDAFEAITSKMMRECGYRLSARKTELCMYFTPHHTDIIPVKLLIEWARMAGVKAINLGGVSPSIEVVMSRVPVEAPVQEDPTPEPIRPAKRTNTFYGQGRVLNTGSMARKSLSRVYKPTVKRHARRKSMGTAINVGRLIP